MNFAQITQLYVENALAALRTAGALLIGNAALMYFEVVGKDPATYGRVLLLGLSLMLCASIPLAATIKLFRKE